MASRKKMIRKAAREQMSKSDKTVNKALSKRKGTSPRKSLKPSGRVLMPRPLGPKGKGSPKRKK